MCKISNKRNVWQSFANNHKGSSSSTKDSTAIKKSRKRGGKELTLQFSLILYELYPVKLYNYLYERIN